MNVIALFTTNHLESIDPTFLRGKRIGTIISMGYLDAVTAEQYITSFCEGIELTGDFAPVYDKIAVSNIAPAFMAEIIENCKSTMVISGVNTISAGQFNSCIASYLRQVELSKTKDKAQSPARKLASALVEVIHTADHYEKIQEVVKEVWEN